jgi:hypothetical protein
VHYSASLSNSGELHAVGNGGSAASFFPSGGLLPSIPFLSNLSRSSWDQRHKKPNTPSRVLLLMSPSAFGNSRPRSVVRIQNGIYFDLFKSEFSGSIYRIATVVKRL